VFIEIRKTDFINKGAELMLRAIVAMLRQNIPGATLVMAPPPGYDSYMQRCELGLYQKMWLNRCGVQWGYFGDLVPKKLRQMYGMVTNSEIDVVLDASGFSYSDHWGTRGCQEVLGALKKWKKQGTKVIFMPQAFGPFTNFKNKQSFKNVLENADLVYSRDKVSYRHLTELAGIRDNIRIAPDFTNLIQGELPDGFDTQANRFCIIPNYRMIDKTGQKKNSYISFLVTCVKHLQEKGEKPFILIHEGKNDLWIGNQVANNCEQKINIVQQSHALYIKGIIGVSSGVISSRFHGLVSALSQGVPALGTGWSHKYEELFNDYGFPEGMLSVDASPEEIYHKIDLITSEIQKQKEIILKAAQRQKTAVFKMWDDIFRLIKQ